MHLKKQMTKLIEVCGINLTQWGCLPLPWGYIHIYDHYFQTSPLIPLGKLKPNSIWSLLGKRGHKFIKIIWVTRPKWQPCPIMVKTFKKLLLQYPKPYYLETWHAASGIKLYKVKINDDLGLTLTYFTAWKKEFYG